MNEDQNNRWQLLILLCLPTLSILLSTNIVMASLVAIGETFPDVIGIGEWTLVIYSITAACLSIPAGDLGDRFGLRRMYGYGLGIFLLGTIGSALSINGEMLLTSRMLSGVGSAILAPVALAFLNRLFSTKEKPIAFGYWAASVTIGTVSGPLLGGWIQAFSDWRYTFPAAACPAVVALILINKLPAYKAESKLPNPDIKGIIGVVLSLGLSLYTLTMGGKLSTAEIILLSILIVLTIVSTMHHLRTTEQPAINLKRLSHSQWWRPSLLQLIIRCLFMAMLILLTGYFHSITGFSELVTSEALLPFLIAVGVMSLSSGYLCKYLGVRNLLLIVFIMALLGALTLLSTNVNGFRWIDWVAMVPIGLLAGSTSQLSRLALSNFTPEESMRGASLNTLVINLGLSIGAAYPSLVRSIELSNSSLEHIIPKNQLLNIMHNEIMILILLFSVGIWQATKIKDAKV